MQYEHKDPQPPETYIPSDDELKARRKRNLAIAFGLAAFMVFVFLTMLGRIGVF